jgi:hypothetical protein
LGLGDFEFESTHPQAAGRDGETLGLGDFEFESTHPRAAGRDGETLGLGDFEFESTHPQVARLDVRFGMYDLRFVSNYALSNGGS